MEQISLNAKVVVLGAQGVGKTSLVIRFVGNMFSQTVSPTIGASFFTYKMTMGKYRIKLQIWDTAGQERFRAMAPMYYRNSNAALLIYDITCMDSYGDMKNWIKELKRNVDTPLVMCIIGNKSDLTDERQISTGEASDFSYNLDSLFYETSALTNKGVEEVFLELGKELIRMYEENPHCGLVPQGVYGPGTTPAISPDGSSHESPSDESLSKSRKSSSCAC